MLVDFFIKRLLNILVFIHPWWATWNQPAGHGLDSTGVYRSTSLMHIIICLSSTLNAVYQLLRVSLSGSGPSGLHGISGVQDILEQPLWHDTSFANISWCHALSCRVVLHKTVVYDSDCVQKFQWRSSHTFGQHAVLSWPAFACGASAWNSDTVSVLCRERLWVEVDLKRRYRNSLSE